MKSPAAIQIQVDPSNPGQFFACCGLFELADRMWGSTTACFTDYGDTFCIQGPNVDHPRELWNALVSCSAKSSMGASRIERLKKLRATSKDKRSVDDINEMSDLQGHLEQEQMLLGEPFDFAVNWWQDSYSGGQVFKTWAGLQLISELIDGVQRGLRESTIEGQPSEKWLTILSGHDALPLYFDSDIGGQSSSLDVGFSLDSLRMALKTRPMIELAAFVGLQRFRPTFRDAEGNMAYSLWHSPLPPLLAGAVSSGSVHIGRTSTFTFRLLYRTKYLKSFLPGQKKETVNE